jgi:hypothetical protein
MSYIDQTARSAKRTLESSRLCLWHLSVTEISIALLPQDFWGLLWINSSTAKTSRTINGY